jgi:hypothetical protein
MILAAGEEIAVEELRVKRLGQTPARPPGISCRAVVVEAIGSAAG